MNICHVITRLIIGGAQENTLLSCAGLVQRGHRVTLLAGPETGPEGTLWPHAEQSGATLIRLQSLRRNPHPILDARCLRELTAVFRAGSYDVVHTHSSKAGILGRWAAHRARVPRIFHTIHGMSFNRTQRVLSRSFYRFLERRASRWTTHFVTVADAMTDQAVAAGLAPRDRFTTVYSGIRTDLFQPDAARREVVRREWNVKPNDVVVGTVARLFRNKGHEEIIEAMPAALAQSPNLRFVWIGNGAHRDDYQTELTRIGLRDRVHFAGLVPPDEIPLLINGFDILLHASRWEGLPRALVQGLLMQVPGISFDNDGAPEVIIHGQTGLLVRLGDPPALAAAINRLAADPNLRRDMGLTGRARCLDRFNADGMVTRLEELYTTC